MRTNAVKHGSNRPDRAAALLGTVQLHPTSAVIAGQLGAWTLTYIVGGYGVDEGGTIKFAHRFASDWQTPQFDRPSDSGYTSVVTTGAAKLAVRYDRKGHVRPWMKCIVIDVYDGSLAPGDLVTLVLGDQRHGSPGMHAQTFVESSHVFQVFVDPTNACSAQAVPGCPTVPVVADVPASLVLTLTSQARIGQQVAIHVRGQDRWGNPTPTPHDVALRWQGSSEVEMREDGLIGRTAGHGRVIARWRDADFASNPIRLLEHDATLKHYWGDLHAQTDATVGTGTEDEYFRFARDIAHLDFASHQGNDFQMTDADWHRLNQAVREYHSDGRFVVFPGYEWSANTPAGGDRNVFYLHEDLPIIRSSAWQLADQEGSDLGAHVPVGKLFAALRQAVPADKVLCGSHVGGRYADIRAGFDDELGPLIEVVSCWGVFEWLLHDALELGHVFAVMANSDGHKGRPGAEGPGAGEFGIAGGLTCVLAQSQTRDAIFAALKQRHCYGTTGARMLLAFTANGAPMGSILTEIDGSLHISAQVIGANPLDRLQLFRDRELVHEVTSPAFQDVMGSDWIRLTWQGSRIRGRARRVTWDGDIELQGTTLREARPHAFDSPGDGLSQITPHGMRFTSKTTGDIDGVDLHLATSGTGRILFRSAAGLWEIDLADLSHQPQVRDFGGVDMTATVRRYPASNHTLELEMSGQWSAPRGRPSAWYVKAIQSDGQTAWSSPIFVR